MYDIKNTIYQINNIGNLSKDDNYTLLVANYSQIFGIAITIKLYSSDNLLLSIISFNIKNEEIELTFLDSKYEDKGNAKKILLCFKKLIDILESILDIKFKRILGELSTKDYDHWEKLIYLYFSIYSCYPMIIDHKYTPLEFIQIMKSCNKNVEFEIIR